MCDVLNLILIEMTGITRISGSCHLSLISISTIKRYGLKPCFFIIETGK